MSAAARADVDFSDAGSRTAYYQGILDDPRMQEVVETEVVDASLSMQNLKPSCATATASAAPPRRLVQTIQALGEHGALQSLCGDHFGEARDLLIERIGLELGGCLCRAVAAAPGWLTCCG